MFRVFVHFPCCAGDLDLLCRPFRRWVYSRKKRPLSVRDPVRHLAVEGLLNYLHNVPSRGRSYKLANPVDASRESCRQRANFDYTQRLTNQS